MNIKTSPAMSSVRRKKMLALREELLAVEKDRAAGRAGCTVDELDAILKDAINTVEHGQTANV